LFLPSALLQLGNFANLHQHTHPLQRSTQARKASDAHLHKKVAETLTESMQIGLEEGLARIDRKMVAAITQRLPGAK
jgi:hypothetical protein